MNGHAAVVFQDAANNWWILTFEAKNRKINDIVVFLYQMSSIEWNEFNRKDYLSQWDPDHDHMSRGITLHKDEAKKLYELLKSALK